MKPFKVVPVLEGASEEIETLTYFDSALFLGTKGGSIHRYDLAKSHSPEELGNSAVRRGSVKVNGKNKRVEMLGVVPQRRLLLALSDGNLQVLPTSLESCGHTLCRGVSSFAVHTEAPKAASTSTHPPAAVDAVPYNPHPSPTPDIVVSLRKKLVLYHHNGVDFTVSQELSSPEAALCLAWHQQWLCIGYRREYSLIHLGDLQAREIFTLDVRSSPRIATLPDDELLLAGQEGLGIFFNLATQQPSQKNSIQWPKRLLCFGVCCPYVMGGGGSIPPSQPPSAPLPSAGRLIEIYSLRDQKLCQTCPFDDLRAMCDNEGRLFAASERSVSCLSPIPYQRQLQKLLLEVRVQAALELLNANFGPDDPRRAQELQKFHVMAGWALFNDLQFPVAFQHFSYSRVDLQQLMKFWKAYLPAEWEAPPPSPPTPGLALTGIPEGTDISQFIQQRLTEKKGTTTTTPTTVAGSESESVVAPGEEIKDEGAAGAALLELANSSVATFLLKERSALVLGRSDGMFDLPAPSPFGKPGGVDVDQREGEEEGGAGVKGGEGSEGEGPSVSWLLRCVDTMLLKLLVEGDDMRWRELLMDAISPLTCTLEDSESFLTRKRRPDVLAVIHRRDQRYENALQIWRSIINEEIECDVSASTFGDPMQEIAHLLTAFASGALDTIRASPFEQPPVTAPSSFNVAALIQEYAPLVLARDPQLGLRIFTAPGSQLCPLTPDEILEMLANASPSASSSLEEAYLEHLTWNQKRAEPTQRTQLALIYAQSVLAVSPERPPGGDGSGRRGGRGAESEGGKAGAMRRKLLQYLEEMEGYDVDAILKVVEPTWLKEETVVLYGKAHRHEAALSLLIHTNSNSDTQPDLATAEAYCLATNHRLNHPSPPPASRHASPRRSDATHAGDYHHAHALSWENQSIFSPTSVWRRLAESASRAGSDGVKAAAEGGAGGGGGGMEEEWLGKELAAWPSSGLLFLLLKVLLNTREEKRRDEESRAKGTSLPTTTTTTSSFFFKSASLRLLSKYAGHRDLDPVDVTPLLPGEWALLTEVVDYWTVGLRTRLHAVRSRAIEEHLSSMAFLKTHQQWSQLRSRCVTITGDRSCPLCTRRILDKAFVAYPDGTCVHLQCDKAAAMASSTGSN
ncbi:unnamed protein product [Vitrella brassicaformis CCMP3155]|uniref:CNH domain-containing protein n=3 Tax=Vitrella brassicaformis TaxID=1169539 RepID=A0A0G4EGS0_VITBC|nr:unnamed protein product [Vitrella brassicaformis CCMP3155]|eukprot:CEL95659.1 unnamed protein product [Vitrella brassicaformis CCMP3155]